MAADGDATGGTAENLPEEEARVGEQTREPQDSVASPITRASKEEQDISQRVLAVVAGSPPVCVVDVTEVPNEQCRDSRLEEEEQHPNPFLNNVGGGRLSSSSLAPKPQFRHEVSVARWDEDMRLGEIIKKKGSIWTSMGVIRNSGKLYCTIEEILFLVERGALHLLDEKDVVLSLNDIYKKVSEGQSGCSWECFVVYRHLKSLGYIVRRHGLPWALKRQKTCCFDTPLSSNSLFAKLDDNEKSDGEVESDVHITRFFEAMQINGLKLEFDIFLPNSKFKKASPGNPNFVLSLISEKPPTRQEVEDLERQCSHAPLKFCNVDHGRVSFYSFDKIELPVLP